MDVGGKYDPEGGAFDHHQKGFDETLPGHGTKLSSAGLVYKHFGREVIAALTAGVATWPAHVAEVVYEKVYADFVEAIDGIDNGVDVALGQPKAYRVSTDLSSRVGRLFPAWNEPQGSALVNECFRDALLLTGAEVLGKVTSLAKSWWPARSVVEQAMDARNAVDPSGHVMVLESGGLPWQTHVFDIEAERAAAAGGGGGDQGRLLFVLYEDSGGKWRVQAVPEAEGSFESRLKLGTAAWRGLRDDALSEACGLPGAVFVHAAGFIGGHETRAGALGMALQTIALNAASEAAAAK